MGELERQRQARDLWISKGHVVAYVTGTLLLGLFMFGMGYRMGGEVSEESSRLYETSLVSAAPDQELVQVLDRVDAMKDPLGHKQMTYPELRDPIEQDMGAASAGMGATAAPAPAFHLAGAEGGALPEDVPVTQPRGWVVVLDESSELETAMMLQGRVDASGSLETQLGWGLVGEERVFWLMRQGFASKVEAEAWLEQHLSGLSSAGASSAAVREFAL